MDTESMTTQAVLGSFCTGSGALDLAVGQVYDVRHAWHAETDPDASKVLAAHWPDVPNHGDIRATDWASVEPVDILTAGFPCQPVSAAGQHQGLDDKRWLFDDIADAVGRMDTPPRMLVLENVRGLLTANGGHAMARVVHRLARLGYVGRYRVVSASDVGAAHRRQRVFIVARPANADGGGWRADVADARAGRPDVAGGGDLKLFPTPRARDHKGRDRNPRGVDLNEAIARLPPRGNDPAAPVRWGDYAPAITRWEHAIGRPTPDPTEPSRKGEPRLAPAFVEWLMGQPAGWVTDHLPRPAALRVLGNGVVPAQGAHAVRLLAPTKYERMRAYTDATLIEDQEVAA